jgi:phosphinothricin acetyltransferase
MVAKEYKIREVKLEDAERLAEIYSYYVQNTAVSFEY